MILRLARPEQRINFGQRFKANSFVMIALLGSAVATSAAEPKVGERLPRRGDEIVVCGQLFHTNAPVVLWTDPGGYDAYRVQRRFVSANEASQKREADDVPIGFGMRRVQLTPEQRENARTGGWKLGDLQDVVDQFVIHYDVAGTSRRCFQILHDSRALSVQFMLDLDGTIYQTLDLKEGAWHATKANGRSIGIEIANMGAYSVNDPNVFDRWYKKESDDQVRILLPDTEFKFLRTIRENPASTWVPRPSRSQPVIGTIHGKKLQQYDLTPEQYDSLTKLTATLCTVFPKLKCDYPRDPNGSLIETTLPDAEYDRFQGVLGHFHVQSNKTDPGPAFQWDRVIKDAQALMKK